MGDFGGLFLAYHDRDAQPAMWHTSLRVLVAKFIPALAGLPWLTSPTPKAHPESER